MRRPRQARAGIVIISETIIIIREAKLRGLGHVKRKSEEEAIMRTRKIEISGHRHVGRPELNGEIPSKNTRKGQECR